MRTIAPIAIAPAEAARLTGIGRTRVFDLMSKGHLPSFKVGRSRLIRVADLQAFIDRTAEAARVEVAA